MTKSATSTTLRLAVLLAGVATQQCLAFAPPSPLTSSPFAQQHQLVQPSSALFASRASKAQQLPEPVIEEDPTLLDNFEDLIILGLRLGTCSLMIHHGFDKIQNVDGFSANVVAKFFGFLPGPASFWTLSAAGTQIAGAGLLSVGILARPVALSMMATMAVAVVFHLLNTGGEGYPFAVIPAHSYNFELAAMYVGVLAYFGTSGAGNLSVDEKVFGGELNLYGNLWNGVFGGSSDDEE